jgi:hypothetical protein
VHSPPLSKYRSLFLGIAIGSVAALFSLLEYSRAISSADSDENHFSARSMQFMHDHGRPLVYLYSNAYMAPFQEILATAPYFYFQERILVLRALGAVFIGLSCALLFVHLNSIYGWRLALAVAVLVALPNGADQGMRLFLPGYPVGLLACVVLFASLTCNIPRHYLLKGMLAGGLHYIFPVLAPYVVIYMAVLCAFAADDAGLFAERWRLSYLAWVIEPCLMILPPIYFYFTTGSFPADVDLVALLVVGSVGLASAILFFVIRRIGLRRTRALSLRLGLLAAGFVVIAVSHVYLFHKFDEPFMTAHHVELNRGNVYRLEPYPAWPRQTFLAVSRILPIAASPIIHGSLIASDQTQIVSKLPYVPIGLLVAIGIIAGATNLCRSASHEWRDAMPRVLYPAAFLLTFLIMIPSRQLNVEYSVRYILPALPGMWLLLCFASERFVRSRSMLAIVFAYVAVVCFGLTMSS